MCVCLCVCLCVCVGVGVCVFVCFFCVCRCVLCVPKHGDQRDVSVSILSPPNTPHIVHEPPRNNGKTSLRAAVILILVTSCVSRAFPLRFLAVPPRLSLYNYTVVETNPVITSHVPQPFINQGRCKNMFFLGFVQLSHMVSVYASCQWLC